MSPRPKKETSYTALVGIKLSPAMKRHIEETVLRIKLERKDLPPRWGISDYLRELITADCRAKGFKEEDGEDSRPGR